MIELKRIVKTNSLPRLNAQTHLCGVVHVLKGRVAGHHGSKVRQGTDTIEPALGEVWLRTLKKLDH